MSKPRILLIASENPGKLREFRALLADLPLQVMSAAEYAGRSFDVVEDGDTFEANALKKAKTIATELGQWAISDDSGLEVDALGGAPGVFSARFAGAPKDDDANNAKLLADLREVPAEKRTARYQCVLAFVDPQAPEQPLLVSGAFEGSIATHAKGEGGFGYDPYFLLPDGRHMAELAAEEKNRISHRALALQALLPKLETYMAKAKGE